MSLSRFRWHPAIGSALVACVGMVVAAAVPFRGIHLWGLWLVEHTARFEGWLDSGTREALQGAFASDPRMGALPAWIVAAIFDGDELLQGLRLLALAAAAVAVFSVSELARHWRGPLAGVAAGLVLWCTPRFWAAATVPSPTIFVAAAVALATWAVVRSRTSVAWTGAALPALVILLWSSHLGWFWLGAIFVVLFVDYERGVGAGAVTMRPVTLAELAVLPAAIALALALHPWWQRDPADHLGDDLRAWLVLPAEPFLWFGERFGARRMLWWAAPSLALFSMPLVALVPSLLGLWLPTRMGGNRAGRGVMLTLTGASLLMLWSLRSPWHAGTDLVLVPVLWLSVAAGMGFAALSEYIANAWATRRGPDHVGTGAGLGRRALVFAPAAALLLATGFVHHAHPEAAHSALLGGVRGAVLRGFWRNPHAPVPIDLADSLAPAGEEAVVSVPVNDWEWRPVLAWYERAGMIDGTIRLAPPAEAPTVVLVHEDGLPEFYTWWRDVDAVARTEGGLVQRVSVGPFDVPLVTVVRKP